MNIVVFLAYSVDADELRWMYACSLSLSVPAQPWSDTRAAHVHMWEDHGGPAVYGGDGGVSI